MPTKNSKYYKKQKTKKSKMKTEKQERRKIQSAEGKTPIAASRPHLVRLTTHPEPALRLGRGKRRHEAPPTGCDGHMRRSSVQIASSPRAEGGGGDEAALGHASEFRHSLSHLHTDRQTHSSQNITRKKRKEKKNRPSVSILPAALEHPNAITNSSS